LDAACSDPAGMSAAAGFPEVVALPLHSWRCSLASDSAIPADARRAGQVRAVTTSLPGECCLGGCGRQSRKCAGEDVNG
jgi:hypothetical protein